MAVISPSRAVQARRYRCSFVVFAMLSAAVFSACVTLARVATTLSFSVSWSSLLSVTT